MKIAVYCIAKNEAKHVERFVEAVKEIGMGNVFVVDTGSTDSTMNLLRMYGAHVQLHTFDPWRFDVARNAALALVPNDFDVAFSLDLDEVPTPGWAAAVQRAFQKFPDRIRYKFVWNHLPDGSDGITFFSEKCHTRHGWHWVKPVHEILRFKTPNEVQATTHEFVVHHWADDSKPRTSYLPLLALSVQEEPDDDRNAHYYGRELHNYGQHKEAINELTRHLQLKTALWPPERAASMRLLSKSHAILGDVPAAHAWALRACAEAPEQREPWLCLAQHYLDAQNFAGCYYAAQQALHILTKPISYICEPEAWGARPYDLAGIAAFYLGRTDEARQLLRKAYDIEPTDPRLLKNLEFVL